MNYFSIIRQFFDMHMKISHFMVSCSFALIMCQPVMLSAQEYQPLMDITATASNYIVKQMPAEYTIKSLQTGKIDSRMKFKKCQQDLSASISGIFRVNNHFTVGVQCTNPQWRFFVSIKAVITTYIVVANTTILKGEYISKDKLKLVKEKISGQHSRYFKQINNVAGKEAKRTIKANKPITANQLQPNYLVKRKQQVLIVAKNPRLMVKMKGIALKNGKQNDRIKVRNSKSNKIVEGVVSAQGIVTVNF
jgi:flagellar basal body P-ring formation protein FlgA